MGKDSPHATVNLNVNGIDDVPDDMLVMVLRAARLMGRADTFKEWIGFDHRNGNELVLRVLSLGTHVHNGTECVRYKIEMQIGQIHASFEIGIPMICLTSDDATIIPVTAAKAAEEEGVGSAAPRTLN